MHTQAMCSIKYNGVCHWTMARTSLAISKICSQDIQVTIRFSDRPRQFRLIGYQLDESRALRWRTNYDGFLDSRASMIPLPAQPFPLAICFGPRQEEAVSLEDRISIRRIRMTVTGLLRRIYSFYRFRRVVWIGRRDWRASNFDDCVLTMNHNAIDI